MRDGVGVGAAAKRHGRLIVSLDKIIEDPRNERKTFRGMDGLVASIEANGVIEPLTVTLEESGRYKIITGHRRFRAARHAGLKDIEILIRDPEHEAIRRRKSVISNVQREDLGPVEMAEALQALLDEDQAITNQQALAETIGKDKRWVNEMLGILRLPPELQAKVRISRLSIPYDSIVKIARLSDRQLQDQLVDDLLKGATATEIRNRIAAAVSRSSTQTALPKPRQVFHTTQHAAVIVQSKGKQLSPEQIRGALEEALVQAAEL